jgi:hypothetical protein
MNAFIPDPVAFAQTGAVGDSERSRGLLERSARRALLRCSRESAKPQDQIEAAELLRLMGFDRAARLIYDIVFLQAGFSPFQRRIRAEIGVRTGLWAPTLPSTSTGPAVHPIDLAVDSLADLMAANAPTVTPPRARQAFAMEISRRTHSGVPTPQSNFDSIVAELPALCARLCGLLDAPGSEDVWRELEGLFARLETVVLRGPAMNPFSRVGADVPEAAALLAFHLLRRFLYANYDLAFGLLGSARLFHSAAQLDDAGLGPYFSNAPIILRGGLDKFALVELAASKIGKSGWGDASRFWAFLLSMSLPDSRLREFVEDLGDVGELEAIWLITRARTRAPENRPDRALLWCARDAGLDGNDLDLAALAQLLIAQGWPDDKIEWQILGDIEGTRGKEERAESAFLRALALAPEDQDCEDRLQALREDCFDRFFVTRGYGTPSLRREIRRQRYSQSDIDSTSGMTVK